MPSSTSSLLAEPSISVVIGSMASPEALRACLDALEPQRSGVEVLVCESTPTRPELHRQYDWARFLARPGRLVPELWRDGVDEATGDIVALTISPMVPAANWVESIREEHRDHDAVGGAIDPGEDLRASDWAEYFCRYAREMRPFSSRESGDLAGDNAAYKRSLLERWRAEYRDGFWEPVFHRQLKREGIPLWHTPSVIVFQGRSSGAAAFVQQRLKHGWKYGHQRGAHFSRGRNVVGVAGAPLVPFLMTARVLHEVFSRGRYRLRALAVLPLIFGFNLVWAAAEAAGHLDMVRRDHA
jgi:hypothetical protein